MSVVRRFVHVIVIVLTLVIGATAAAVVVSQTAWFRDWLRGFIVTEANQYLNGDLRIERLDGNLFFGVELENISVSMDGAEVLAAKSLAFDYDIFELIAKGLSVDRVYLDRPVLHLRRDGDAWSIARLIKAQDEEVESGGAGYPIAVRTIGVGDASIVIDDTAGAPALDVPNRLDGLDADLSLSYDSPERYAIEVRHVSFRGSEPAIALRALSGGVAVRDDTLRVEKLALRSEETSLSIDGEVRQYLTQPVLNLRIVSDSLSLPEIARVVKALADVSLKPAFDLTLDGPMDRLGVGLSVRSSAGQLSGEIVADVLAPHQSVAGGVSVRRLDLAPIIGAAQPTDLTAEVRMDVGGDQIANLDSLRGTVEVNAPRVVAAGYAADGVKATAQIEGRRVKLDGRAAAYGATVTARGRVTLPDDEEPLSYDVGGTARGLDLRRLPPSLGVPPAATDFNAEYQVRGTELASSRRVDAELRFAESTVAGARIEPGSIVELSMAGSDIRYAADAAVADLDLQRIGLEFDVPALATDQFLSTLNVKLTASGRGTDPSAMEVTASGSLTDSVLAGGRVPRLSFDAALANDAATVRAAGSFAGFDPAEAAGNPALQGSVGGTIEVDAKIAAVSTGVSAETVAASAQLTLERSTIGGLDIDRAVLVADYRDLVADIRQLEIVGREINVQASGPLALNDTGQSNLQVRADASGLEEIGEIIEAPLSGIAKIDLTVTGNRTALEAKGTLAGSSLKYGENGALSLSTTYSARIPDLAVDRATVDAETSATFITVGGQDINALAATTSYSDKRLQFDATAEQRDRSLTIAGALTLHPEHQEVHVQNLGFDSRGVRWQLAAGSDATVRYGGDAITVTGLQLVSENQAIRASGTFGRPGDVLNVTLANVDLASIDALMMRPPQLSGRLDASGALSGTTDSPQVQGEFRVNGGGFRQFEYDTFGGAVSYTGRDLMVDARLEQSPTEWITAKGLLPVALFGGSDEAGAGDAKIDFTVDSSAIDLGLVQGFTTALTGVEGTLEAHLRLTGTAADPQPSGAISIRDGAMKIEPTGVAYTNIAGRIDLEPDRVRISHLSALDGDLNTLSLSGDLAVNERRVGGVRVYVTAEHFTLLDNELGTARIEAAMDISGELTAPRVEGYLGVNSADINLDEVIALLGSSPYPADEEAAAEEPDGVAEEPPAPGPLDAVTMDVQLTVSNDLVVKADNLQTPGSSVGLGALNLTLGGDLRATKERGGPVRLTGVVNTIRGTYDFQGRRFEILRDGSVRFAGLDELNPSLDIRTRRMIQGVEARVNIRGTLDRPEIVLSSTPPLEQGDILALIVFNQPINQLGEGQQISLAQRAQSIATGAVAGQLAQSIGRALNLDTFEINLAPESGGSPEVTVGQQVGENLYMRVQQGVGESSTTNVILEYELAEWLRLRTNVIQGASTQQSLFSRAQGSGVDLIFFLSY